MRVVLIVHEFPKASEAFIVDKFLGLLALGLDVHLVAETESDDASLFPELANDFNLRKRIHAWPRKNLRRLITAVIMGLTQAAVTHPVRLLCCTWVELRRSLREAPGRIVFATPIIALQPDIIHLGFGSVAAHRIDLKDAIGCRVTASFRGFDINYYGLDNPDFYDEVQRNLERMHFLGKDLRDRARQRGFSDQIPTALIPPAVDTDVFRPRQRDHATIGTKARPCRLLSVGRLHWKKGYEYGLAAVRSLMDDGIEVDYRIVGGGLFKDAVRSCVNDFDLQSRVKVLGVSNREFVRQEMQWADVFLHPAVSEGFSNAVMEAQAMELPVICTDADGLAENVAHGVTGFVVERRDAKALAQGITKLTQDATLRQEMGAAGRDRVSRLFRCDLQLRAFQEFFREVMET